MLDVLQRLLIGSTFAERKQKIEQVKTNQKLQKRLKYQFVWVELAKIAAADPQYTGGFSSVQEWKEKLAKWETISKNTRDFDTITDILDLPSLESINIADLPLETKKVLDGIINDSAADWVKNKKIISGTSYDSELLYKELNAYQNLKNLTPDSSTGDQEIKNKLANLESKFEEQQHLLEKIHGQFERLLSKTRK